MKISERLFVRFLKSLLPARFQLKHVRRSPLSTQAICLISANNPLLGCIELNRTT